MIDLVIFIRTLQGGGAERVATSLIESLTTSISRKIVTIYDTDIKYNILEKPIVLQKYVSNKFFRKIILPLNILRTIIICKNESPKIVLSFLDYDNILNLITSLVCNYTPIISVHGIPSFQGSIYIGGKFIQRLQFILARMKHAPIIAVSQGVKNELISDYKIKEEQITVLYNPININNINTISTDSIFNLDMSNIPTIINVGSLSVAKGQWHLIRAFAELRRTHTARLIILGEGTERQYLETLVTDYNLSNDVFIMGWRDNPYKYMAKSTGFVLSSLSESFGNVIIEAMTCGCPIITSDCSESVHEILGDDGEYGLIAKKMSGIRHSASEPLDEGEESLVELMKQVLDDDNLRRILSENGRKRAEYFSTERRMREYEEFLNRYL